MRKRLKWQGGLSRRDFSFVVGLFAVLGYSPFRHPRLKNRASTNGSIS
jgi:hypothetical protein